MFQKIINFFKYHNAFAIGISLVLVLTFSAMASEDVRNAVIGEKIVTEQGVDNSQLLPVDLDNFDVDLKIDNVLEDEENYYIDYSFNTIAVRDNVWQPVVKAEKFTVNKNALGNRDLGIYLAEELGEVAQAEITYLKKAQKTERERGLTQIVRTTDYTGLIGLTLDLKNKVLPGYEPVIKPPAIEIAQITQPLIIEEPPIIEKPVVEELVCQPSEEICDGADNNCDGQIDEGGVCPKEEPLAPSGAGEAAPVAEPICDVDHLDLCTTQELCEGVSLYWYNEICNLEPETPACQPTGEVCDGIDNDCDELIDEDLGQATCGVGACAVTIDNCIGGQSQTCTPGTPTEEICDQIDNNCDGQIDEGSVCVEPPTE